MTKRSLLTASAAVVLHLALCGGLQAAGFNTNLIVNPSAEDGPASSTGDLVGSIPGWTSTSTFTVVPYDTPAGTTGFPKTTDPGPPDRGLQFFAGGSNVPAPVYATVTSTATQEIDVAANATEINNESVGYALSAYLGGYATQPDNARVRLNFFHDTNLLGTTNLGPVTTTDRDPDAGGSKTPITALLFRSKTGQVPIGTTRIQVQLIMTKFTGGNSNDGYADNLSLSLVSAVPTNLTVMNNFDAGPNSLRDVINYANTHEGGFNIRFAPGIGTITLTTGQIVISHDMNIIGLGARALIIRGGNSRIFEIATSASVNISGVTLRDSKGGTLSGTLKAGGAVANYGTAQFFDCTIRDNTVGDATATVGWGGAIYNPSEALLRMERCTLAANTVRAGQALGGAIYNNGSAVLTNCTVASNQLITNGGSGFANNGAGAGIYNLWSNAVGDLALINCSITDNFAGPSPAGASINAGGVRNGEGPAICTVRNTIIARNQATTTSRDVAGPFISQGHNLIGNTAGSTGWISSGNDPNHDFLGGTTDPTALDPQLTVLQDNGGPTDTLGIKLNSIAIDNGSDSVLGPPAGLAIDQRGFVRKSGDHVDIGAFEKGPAQAGLALVVTNTSEHDDGTCSIDDCTLLEALNFSNAGSDVNSITFTPGLTGAIGTAILTPTGLPITKPVTINGPGARVLVITGRTVARVFKVTSANVAISGLGIYNGKVTGDNGGAIHNTGGLTLTNCLIINSVATLTTAGGGGGGVENALNATLIVNGCTFLQNSAGQVGGGIHNAGTLTVTNSTFSQNSAIQGGGIYSDFSNNLSKASLLNCTITRCSASDTSTATGAGGGGLFFVGNSGQYDTGNTLIAGNTSTTNPDLRGNFKSNGHNFIGNVGFATGFADGTLSDQIGGGPKPVKDAKLDAVLKNNGGPTDTHALLSDSTAINAGGDSLAPTTDQRAFLRNGISDIGAFEYNGIMPTPPTITIGAATNITSTAATLNASVNPNGFTTSFQFTSNFGSFPVQDAGNGTGNVPFSLNVTGLTPNTQYSFNAVAANSGGSSQGIDKTFTTLPGPTPIPTATPTATPSATPTPPAGSVGNVSTRLPVGTGDDVLIEGFIVQGPSDSTKTIIVRAIGPSLLAFGIPDALANPTLEIHDASNATIATNDDWKTTQIGGLILGDQSAEIGTSGVAPGNDLESAIIADLAPGSYTAVVRGFGDTSGTGVVDAYDLGAASPARLANIATRGLIQPGDKLMIAGFIVQNGPVRAVIRAVGPSLSAFGIANALADTTLQLKDQNGTTVIENDNWKTDQQTELESTGLQPSHELEAAVVATIQPGQYTAQVRGKNETSGIGVVQVYFLQ
jgi:hypothetical protein